MQYTPPVKTPSSLTAPWDTPERFDYSSCAVEAFTCENRAAFASFEDRLAMLERAQSIWKYIVKNSSGPMRKGAADKLEEVRAKLHAAKDALEAAPAAAPVVTPSAVVAPPPGVRRPSVVVSPLPEVRLPAPAAQGASAPVTRTSPPPAPSQGDMDIDALIKRSAAREGEAVALCKREEYAAAHAIYAQLADAWTHQAESLGGGAMKTQAQGFAEKFSKTTRDLAAYLPKPVATPQAHQGTTQQSEIEDRVMSTLTLRSSLANAPDWDRMAGMDDVKDKLLSALVDPIIFRDYFTGERKPPRGVLLYGPAGNGKTTLIRSLVRKLDAMFADAPPRNLFTVTGADINSKWVGESEKFVQTLFKKAREMAPALVVLDEVEELAGDRSRRADDGPGKKVLNQFLTELDGVEELGDVMVLVTTNFPGLLDEAFKRRMSEQVYLPAPNAEGRAAILQHQIDVYATGHAITPEQVSALAHSKNMENFSADDIRRAAALAVGDGPRRRFKLATHFVRQPNGKVRACTPDTPGSVQGTYTSFGVNSAEYEPFTYEDLRRALREILPTAVNQIKQCDDYQKALLRNKE